MVVMAVVLLLVVAAGIGSTGRPDPRWQGPALIAADVLFAALAALMIVYVASEDDYADAGISRWAAYDAQAVTVAAIASSFAGSTIAFIALRSRKWAPYVVGAAVIALMLNYIAFAEMTN